MFPIEITDIFFYIVSALIIITAIFTVTAKMFFKVQSF